MTRLCQFAMVCAVVAVTATTARADLFNTRPVMPQDNGYESSLQTVFDTMTLGGAGLVDAANDQISSAIFTNSGAGTTASMMIEIAGFAKKNMFGIYNFDDPTKRATIFNGPASAGDVSEITFDMFGNVTVQSDSLFRTYRSIFNPGDTPQFGFFITTPQRHTFFSEDSLNENGDAQAVIYRGDDTTMVDMAGNTRVFAGDELIIAFEDLVYADSDKDFQDMVVFIQSLEPVPAPGAVFLGGLGLILVGWVRRRFV